MATARSRMLEAKQVLIIRVAQLVREMALIKIPISLRQRLLIDIFYSL